MMKSKIDLLSGPVDSSLRKFTAPLAVSFLINMLYSWVDTYFVSRLGTDAIAAIGVSEMLLFITFTIGSGFAVGTGVVVARRVGEQDLSGADKTATQAIIMMFLFSSLLAVTLYFSIDYILPLMQFSDNPGRLASIYLSAVMIGVPGNFIIFQINAIVRSTGNSVFPMLILITTTVLNAIMSPLLIFGIGPFPELGILGAGIGTAFAQITGALISIIAVNRNVTPVNLNYKNFKFDFGIIRTIVKIGFPATLQMMSVSLNRVILISLAKSFGTVVVAAYTLGLKLDLFVFMPIFASGVAIQITTGQNLGAGNLSRVYDFHKSAIKQISVLMVIMGTAVYFGGAYFAKIFTNDNSIVEITQHYLKITALAYVPFSIGILSTRVISGAGDTIRSLLIVSIMILGVQIPSAYLLSMVFGFRETGIWLGVILSHYSFALISYHQLKREKWIKIKI